MSKFFKALEIYGEILFWLVAVAIAVTANVVAISYMINVFALDDMKFQLQLASGANTVIAIGLRAIRSRRMSLVFLFQALFAASVTTVIAIIVVFAIRQLTNLPTDFALMGAYVTSLGLLAASMRSGLADVRRQVDEKSKEDARAAQEAAARERATHIKEQQRRFGHRRRK